jgi:hypothetical protein
MSEEITDEVAEDAEGHRRMAVEDADEDVEGHRIARY